MNASRKFRATLLSGALVAVAAPAAAQLVTSDVYYPPSTGRLVIKSDTYYPPNARYEYDAPYTTYYYYDPAPVLVVETPPTLVVGPRLTPDQMITGDAIENLANDSRLTNGVIGVETDRRDVTLKGRVSTPGQARIAERDVQAVDGVREVHNELRPRVGGSP
jgi:hypothetical protein